MHQMTALAGCRRPASASTGVRRDERAADRGHRPPAGRRRGRRRPPLRRAELHGLAERAASAARSRRRSDPLDPSPPAQQRESLEAIRYLERAVLGGAARGHRAALRQPLRPRRVDGERVVELIRKRKLPVVGDGAGVWSLIHVDDAAAATVAAVERGGRGVYNIVDDEPAPVAEWLPYLAEALGAKPPRHVPAWLGAVRDRRGRRLDDDADPRLVEREGEARARLGAGLAELARGIPRRLDDVPVAPRRSGGEGCTRP